MIEDDNESYRKCPLEIQDKNVLFEQTMDFLEAITKCPTWKSFLRYNTHHLKYFPKAFCMNNSAAC